MSEQPRRRRRQQMPSEEPVMPIEEEVEAVVPQTEIIAPSIPRSYSYSTATPNTRTKTGLLEYIKTAIELETDLATQERIVLECQSDIQRRKPILKKERVPSQPNFKKNEYEAGGLIGCLGTGLMGAIILFAAMSGRYLISGLIWCGILFCVPCGLTTWHFSKQSDKINNENQQLQEAHNQAVEEIKARNKAKQDEYNAAVYQCDASCRAIAEEAQPHIDETRSILSRLYSMGVIYPKYCNLPALTSIYEYYMTGRCEELTGPHGAYNLYEDELRKDTVISQLNTVIENLEQIRHNQYMLYEQVCAIQQNTAAIRSELAQIKGYTIQIAELAKLNAYYAARTEANTRITMYYHL